MTSTLTISDYINQLSLKLEAMTSTQILCNSTTIIIVGVIIYLTFTNRKTRVGKTDLPDLISSLGVLGTFIGIVFGLLGFNPSDLEASVPNLLEGLKTAFITSIAGMGAAYYLKGGFRFFKKPDPELEIDRGTREADNLLTLLQEISKSGKENQKSLHAIESAIGGDEENAISKQLASLKIAIAGDGETSINTQMTKLRTELRDKQDELIKEFRSFAEVMAENNSKAFIKALEEVIRDFNTKITEQFGENFKHLNLAVGQLLTWQENYKTQVEKMVSQLDQNSQAIKIVRESFELIADKSKAYVTTAERLEELLGRFKLAEDSITSTLTALSDISGQAKTFLPKLKERFTEMSDGVAKVLEDSVNTTTSALSLHNKIVEKEFEGFAQAAKKVEENIDATMERTSTHISRLLEENGKSISKSVEILDKTLEEELKKSITSLGRQLTSLSEKFVSDYTPLTEKLQDLVSLSRQNGQNK